MHRPSAETRDNTIGRHESVDAHIMSDTHYPRHTTPANIDSSDRVDEPRPRSAAASLRSCATRFLLSAASVCGPRTPQDDDDSESDAEDKMVIQRVPQVDAAAVSLPYALCTRALRACKLSANFRSKHSTLLNADQSLGDTPVSL
jgi:hypothetical protein